MVKRRKEDFINYMVSVLQNSMLTGIPQIAECRECPPKKILRALVFIFCVVGFIYQSMVFMNIYWQYRTVIDIQVENPKSTEMPSITFCTNNGVIVTSGLPHGNLCTSPIFCTKNLAEYLKNPLIYHHPTINESFYRTEFEAWSSFQLGSSGPETLARTPSTQTSIFKKNKVCATYPDACAAVESPRKIYVTACPGSLVGQLKLMELSYSNYEDYKPFLVPLEKLILTCHADFKKAGETQERMRNIRSPKDDVVVLYACYTIHTRIGLPDAEPDMVQPQANTPNPQPSRERSKLSIINPSHKKCSESLLVRIKLLKGKQKLVPPKKTVKHLLPPPYETKCKNYITEWEARGGNGPTTEKECIEECQRNSSLKIHGCITDLLRGPTNAKNV
ncbi:uncharacterized protein CEXT_496561 [Caerostris extrusa]|uniref:Uncharacterized protein n=1 Tax=Caerostris extrusa TaxID=172846 RepID=A0AAV4SBU1_CAEEX|nr:uncharacterized protein CEXT_496561 [Caerostris extrusa]